MNKLIAMTLCLALFISSARAQDTGKKPEKEAGQKAPAVEKLTDPVEILKKADAACRTVKAVKMEIVVEGDEAVARVFPKIEATVIATDPTREGGVPSVKKYVSDMKYKMPNAAEPRHVTGGSDGENYYLIDHGTKKAHVDIDPQVLGMAGRVMPAAMMIEFLIDQPFNDEITGKQQKLLGNKTIEGEECYEIQVVYANDSEAIWCFSTKDFMPRCRVDITPLQDGTKGKLTKTVKKLDVKPKIDENTFKLKLPEGYTQTEDFAP
jgi:hypothetical protein